MAVYKRTYKAYSGPLTPAWSRFTVLSRYALGTLFNSRLFTGYTVLCFLPFLVGLAFIYFVHSTTAQALLNIRIGPNALVDSRFFLILLGFETTMCFPLAAIIGPGLITKDFANHAVQLYLSRPISRAGYLFGKTGVLAALLSCTTLVPTLVLFFLQAQLQGHGWIWQYFWLAGAIVLSCLLWIAVISLLSMAVAVWLKWRIAATILLFAFSILFPILGQIVSMILRTPWGHIIDFPTMMAIIWAHLFRIVPNNANASGINTVPLWAAWASLFSLCMFCFWLLNRKLRAREVERS
jgi:ABC-type transport system involved in multi-copper enzyme maturation permease subunit